MRQPSPASSLFAWHRAAMRGDAPAVHDGIAECGWFKRRLVKGGPWVPVRIYIVRDVDLETGELTSPERLEADVNGTICDPNDIWTHLTPISREDYRAMIFSPAVSIMHDPRQPIDLSLEPMRP